MKIRSEKTSEVDARTNQKVEKLQFDVHAVASRVTHLGGIGMAGSSEV
jgi:hypothetical protein